MNTKRLLMALLAILLTTSATLAEVLSGYCGANVTYTLDTESGLLKIEGTGQMNDYKSWNIPWYSGSDYVTKAEISNGVTSIGDYVFYGCRHLTSFIIPNSITRIGSSAFYNCTDLTSITIPNSVTSIGNNAFSGCNSLTSITIPNSVISIGDYAFNGCSGLISITIPNSVTSIGDYAFVGCNLTTPVYNDKVFAFLPKSYSGEYNVPDGIISIAGGAFSSCRGLTSVIIPNSVTSIGKNAFENCI